MVVDRKLTVESLGKAFAEHLRNEPDVRELWVAEDEDGFVVSIITDEIDQERELQLYSCSSRVRQQFPEALYEVHLTIPSRYSYTSLAELRRGKLSPDAKKVPLGR